MYMAVNQLDYAQYNSEHSAINTCIGNIEAELTSANAKLQEATAEASGQWATTDVDDWNAIYSDINKKFERLQALMKASGVSAESTQATENAYAGFNRA